MKLVIAGDFCLNNRVGLEVRNSNEVIESDRINNAIQSSDYSIVNLECPILRKRGKSISKIGPSLFNSAPTLELLKKLGFKCVTLANNHINDYGEDGVFSTLQMCEDYGMDYLGIGKDKKDSSKVLYKKIKNETVAIINCCEHEFSLATDCSAGACALNIPSQYYSIQEAKKKADFVVVIVHGGREGWQYPTERMKETYRLFVDFGANAVINHHQHCWSGYEVYNNAPIFYGLGNFFFDWKDKRMCQWNEGILVSLNLSYSNTSFEVFPFNQCDEAPIVRDLNVEEKSKFESQLSEINKVICNPILLSQVIEHFYKESSPFYCDFARPFSNRLLLALKSRGLFPRLYTKKWKMRLLSIIQCESHRENLLYSLKEH